MRRIGMVTAELLLSLLIAGRAAWAAQEKPFDPNRGGMVLRAEEDGAEQAAPVLGTTVEVRVTGVVARARVTQVFGNPTAEWMTGIYLFPLPDGAAVDTLRLVVGDRVFEGVVQEKAQAQETFAAAAREGRKASLLDQLRPDLFTTSVANIGPGETVEVVIELQQVVRFERGRFVLRFPMLAAPRYMPETEAAPPGHVGAELGSAQPAGRQLAPAIPEPPLARAPVNPFALHVDLAPGFPLARIESPTHAVAVEKDPQRRRWAIDLADGAAFADGDFILEWAPAVGRAPRAVHFTEEVDGERYALLMVMPPDDGGAIAERLPREATFVVDTSGSMEGESIEQARAALLLALGRLAPSDSFNVIDFDDDAVALLPSSAPADALNLEQARRFVAGLVAEGGTQMLPALERSLAAGAGLAGAVQQVIFITDGQVGNEAEILGYLRRHLGSWRLFTVAIGSAPNAAFLRRAAELGRGSFTHLATLDRVAAGMADLFARLEAPMLREIEIAWPDPGAEAWPQRVPDLYLGEPLVVAARLGARPAGRGTDGAPRVDRSPARTLSRLGGDGSAAVSGLRAGQSWQEEVPAAVETRGTGLDKLWAGRKIEALMDSLQEQADAEAVRREVIALGLRHHLVTLYTSLVAVDVEPTAPAGVEAVPRLVPLNRPRGSVAIAPAGGADSGGVEDVITVTAESPLLDERRLSTGSVVSQADLERIPTARNPWAALQATPGVLVDRVNTGGNESGQQAAAVATGAAAGQSQLQVDGMAVSDLAAVAGSPSYYDFDAFEELKVETGGADVTLETPGARLKLVRPRGTNEWRGSVFALWSDGRGLAAARSVEAGAANGGTHPGNRLDGLRVADGEVGGPLSRDHAWIWASAGRDELDRVALGGQAEEAVRESGVAKLNAQLGRDTSVVLAWSRGDTAGSGLGAGPDRASETTGEEVSREDSWKGEATHVWSSNLYSTGAWAGSERELRQVPRGDGAPAIDAAGVAHGSWFRFDEAQRRREARLGAEGLWNAGDANHLTFLGAGWRALDESLALGPRELVLASESVGLSGGAALLELWRGDGRVETETFSLWSQDTMALGILTAAFGVRLDGQDLGIAGEARRWEAAPRLALNWALGEDRQTVVRASLARFVSRLGSRAAWHADAGAPGALFEWLPAGALPAPWSGDGLDPLQPRIDPDVVDPDLRPELTDEAVLGVDYAVAPEFVVGLRATWRRTHRLLEERLLVRNAATGEVFAATAGDWVAAGRLTGTLPDGSGYDAPLWDLRPGLSWTGGRLLANGDRERDDLALSLHWEKRLSWRWSSRGHFTWHGGEQRLGREFRRFDDPTNTLGAGDDEGVPIGEIESGRPHERPAFLSARWSFHASGLVELPRGFGLAAAVNGRDGFPLPYYRRIARPGAGIAPVQLTARPDAFRTEDVVTLDGRVDKRFEIGETGLTLSLEGFNLLDEDTILERQLDLGVTRGGLADDVLAPRTLRLGAALKWR
jgi:Ca-activated chloride channel family protein